ncbi:hypothetical protein C8J95_1101 [Elizabethkingia sp. YR214]|nr:hypothetical protein C8J95_1101 [Elizabethkingia sp. YR214]
MTIFMIFSNMILLSITTILNIETGCNITEIVSVPKNQTV